MTNISSVIGTASNTVHSQLSTISQIESMLAVRTFLFIKIHNVTNEQIAWNLLNNLNENK